MQSTILLLVLAPVFYLQYRRNREPMVRMWFWGWVLVILRPVVLAIPAAHGHPWHQARGILADLCTMLPALLFIGSFSPDTFGRKVRVPFYAAMAVPVVLYTVLESFWTEPTPLRSLAMTGLVLATIVAAGGWALRPGCLPRSLTFALIGCAVVASGWNILHGNYAENFFLVESEANLCCAIFLVRKYRRFSAAITLTSASFLAWAVWPWLHTSSWSEPVAGLLLASIYTIHALAALGMVLLLLDAEIRVNVRAKNRERRARREMELYSALDLTLVPGRTMRSLANSICDQIALGSPFAQAALFLRDPARDFYVAGYAGMGIELANGLDAMVRRVDEATLQQLQRDAVGVPLAANSFRLDLSSLFLPDDHLRARNFSSVVVIPMDTHAESFTGVLMVAEEKNYPGSSSRIGLQPDDLLPLESLASKVAIAVENSLLTQRITQSEKLTGLGQLAGGVAHELNNPLTVVMGYAELIEDATLDGPIREQAGIIRSESLRMKRIIESLIRFWRPSPLEDQPIQVGELLGSIHRLRAADLEQRGIGLSLTVEPNLPNAAGNSEQLKQVFLQLLNNAVEAVARWDAEGRAATRHRIRMDASLYHGNLHILFSDTGVGFADPGRVFEPFFTTKQPGEGPGLGLTMCYGVVREHRGEINAFNMHPHGAAVVIELPVAQQDPSPPQSAPRSGVVAAL